LFNRPYCFANFAFRIKKFRTQNVQVLFNSGTVGCEPAAVAAGPVTAAAAVVVAVVQVGSDAVRNRRPGTDLYSSS